MYFKYKSLHTRMLDRKYIVGGGKKTEMKLFSHTKLSYGFKTLGIWYTNHMDLFYAAFMVLFVILKFDSPILILLYVRKKKKSCYS